MTIEDQLATIIGQNEQVIAQLISLNEGVRKMATPDQITALTAAVDDLVAGEAAEEAQIQAVIDALKAGQADQPDPAVDAAITAIASLKERIAAIVPDAAPEPPTGEPV